MSVALRRRRFGLRRGRAGRWRPRWWHQQQRWRGSLVFLVTQMGQYLVDDGLVFDAGDDLDGAAAASAGLHVDVENTLEPLCPGHRGMAFDE